MEECSSRKSSVKEASDGQEASPSDRRDSDILSETEEEYFQKMLSGERQDLLCSKILYLFVVYP